MISVAFTGGGTGGHIYPGLAVAAALRETEPDLRIFWIGSKSGMDRSIVEGAGIEFFGIASGKLRRYFSLQNFFDLFKIAAGFISALFLLKKIKPAALFSKGGFVSVPPAAAAAFLGLSVFTHESDFSPGLATKINSRFAKTIFTAYDKTALFFKPKYRPLIIVSGNPVRSAFYCADPEKGREFLNVPAGEKILLVLGGSQGAKEINDLIQNCLFELVNWFFVVHQTGGNQHDAKKLYDMKSGRYLPLPYINREMPDVLASASVVLARSGAGTVWECAAAGKAMLLVPLCGSGTRGDQVENARFFEEKGAAQTLIKPTPEQLAGAVRSLAEDTGRLAKMAQAAADIGKLRGAPLIARHIAAHLKAENP
jgi:UDP-N-acetylglucosamine--N-acetylmuramyl-(pentapeptide) pyrophosphoryl-undecaprenol N-acetylglucosamine transferase